MLRGTALLRRVAQPLQRSKEALSVARADRPVQNRCEATLAQAHVDPVLPPLQPWGGADCEVVVHRGIGDMVPHDVMMLPGRVFNAPVRTDLVHRVVTWQLAKRRAGTAKTKNRSEVAGSGRKIRPQKGSGRSRQGAITSPLFRGGGRAHGPVPRDYSYPLPANVRRNGLRSVLSSKFACGQLWVVEDVGVADGKTKAVIDAFDKFGWKSVLVLDHCPDAPAGVDPTLKRASHNVQSVLAMNALGANVYDMLSFDMLVMSRAAVEHLRERFSRYACLI